MVAGVGASSSKFGGTFRARAIQDDTSNDTRPDAFAEHPVFAKRCRGGKSLTSEVPFGLRDGCAGLEEGGNATGG